MVFPPRQLDQERTEKQELKRELKVLQRAKDSILCDLRYSNHQLQVELALAQVFTPLPAPCSSRGLPLLHAALGHLHWEQRGRASLVSPSAL